MLDGEETVEIAGESFAGRERDRNSWGGNAGRTGNRGNSLRGASLGESDTACWTDSLRRASLGGSERACLPKGNRVNSLRRASLGGSERACWTDRKPWK